jgi:hypothetical protein
MKKALTTLVLLSAHFFCKAQNFAWATPFSFDDYNIASSLQVDGSGNSLVSGNYYITGSAGPPTGTSGAFIGKLNSTGALVWTDTIKDSDDGGSRVDIDASGNVYLASYITSTHMVGGTPVSSNGLKDILIAKYSSSGALQWVKSLGGSGNDAAQAIAVDALGNIYVAGYFGTTVSFDGNIKSATGYADIFLAKLNSAGTMIWVQTASGDADTTSGVGYDEAMDMDIDNAGNPVIAGYFTGSATFGGSTLSGSPMTGGFIAKAEAVSGNWLWATNTGRAPTGMAISTGGGYIAGSFSGTVVIGPNTFTSAGSTDAYLAKFDDTGTISWSISAGSNEEDRGYDVAIDNVGNPHLTGSFMNSFVLGDTTLIPVGEENAFIAKFDASANLIWAKQVKANSGAWEFVNAHAIAIDVANNPYVAGSFYGAAIFDSFSYTSGNPSDAYVAKINSTVTTGITESAAIWNASVTSQNHEFTILIETTSATHITIQILNALGQELYNENNVLPAGKSRQQLKIPAMSQGIYFINLVSNSKTETKRIFVK